MKLLGGFALSLVMTLTAPCQAQANDSATHQYSKADTRKMVRDAHTADQYEALAQYYRAQETKYRQKARAEIQEWDRRSQNVTGISVKYPRPVDSSRNRYEYVRYEVLQMNSKAIRYENLAASAR